MEKILFTLSLLEISGENNVSTSTDILHLIIE